MSDVSHILSPDTQAVLLLCSSFAGQAHAGVKPLTVPQYNRLANWLRDQHLRPGDLLHPEGMAKLRQSLDQLKEAEAAVRLLERGVALALAVEHWANQGLWVLSRSDLDYPRRFKDQLKEKSPPLLFGAGHQDLLNRGGLAVIGSRHADAQALEFTRQIGQRGAREDIQVISGGAKGVDQQAMLAALSQGGTVVGVLADNLGRATVSGKYRQAIRDGQLVLISASAPESHFHIGNAMARNKLIYALSDWALVVCTEIDKGGTWAGALENLRHNWVPLLVRHGPGVSSGNKRLIKEGGCSLDETEVLQSARGLQDLLQQAAIQKKVEVIERTETSAVNTAETEASSPKPIPLNESAPAGHQPDPDDVWDHQVWPAISVILRSKGQLTVNQLAETLGVDKSQAKAWLKRATEEQKLKKLTRPVRYVNPDYGQKSLLDEQ
ncbi:MAG: DNA-processing protein DprA [Desulfobacca sp.]|nr:DNA-processing protein DprA [Desulfobacca sp.]